MQVKETIKLMLITKQIKDIRLLDNFTYANKDVKQYYMWNK